MSQSLTARFIAAIALAGLLSTPHSANAEDLSAADIRAALQRHPTRNLSQGARLPSDTSPAVAALLDKLGSKSPGTMTPDERSQLDAAIAGKPAIDLVMEFDSNSDVLRGKALDTANKLGNAISDPSMKDQIFAIAGHTDGKGSDKVNQPLSERRAAAVKRLLVEQYHIPAANLISVGYGKSQPRNKHDPLSRENRRVQAVNLLQLRSANR